MPKAQRTLGVGPPCRAQLIQTNNGVTAKVGEEAVLTCGLTQSKDVRQVTWQRVTAREVEAVGTYSRRLGVTINRPFRGKVEFVDTGLQSSAIIVKRVKRQDECCYRCLFNAFPEGALTSDTCLEVHELQHAVLQVTNSSRPGGVTLTCSATGHPAPTLLLATPPQLTLTNSSTITVVNSNDTVTITVTATLTESHRHGSHEVRCQVSQLSAVAEVVTMTIPAEELTHRHGELVDSATPITVIMAGFAVLVVLLLGIIGTVGIILWCMKKSGKARWSGDPERTESAMEAKQEEAPCTPNDSMMKGRSQPNSSTRRRTPAGTNRTPLLNSATQQTPARTNMSRFDSTIRGTPVKANLTALLDSIALQSCEDQPELS